MCPGHPASGKVALPAFPLRRSGERKLCKIRKSPTPEASEMSTIKGKAGYGPQNVPILATGTDLADQLNEVLTLSEAAAYLRVAEAEVLRLVLLQELPGRQIGNEWRFLKAGL